MIKILSCILLFTVSSYCQVINWSPAYPSISDTITITYNSSLGNSELIDTDEIYIHTGVLNKYSSSNHDWMNIPVQWHEGADTLIQMSSLGNNIYEISFKISSFFNVSNIDKNEFIALIFRNEDGSLSGKNNNNTNFYIPLMEQDEFSKFVSPVDFPLLVQPNEEIPINVIARENALINLFINDNLVSQQYNDSLEFIFSTNEIGKHYIHYNIQSAGNIYKLGDRMLAIDYMVKSYNYLIQTDYSFNSYKVRKLAGEIAELYKPIDYIKSIEYLEKVLNN